MDIRAALSMKVDDRLLGDVHFWDKLLLAPSEVEQWNNLITRSIMVNTMTKN